MSAIDAGTLPPVSFYKPQGDLNEHLRGRAQPEGGSLRAVTRAV
jgi:hypothetical protein